jgi:hypothetical protein
MTKTEEQLIPILIKIIKRGTENHPICGKRIVKFIMDKKDDLGFKSNFTETSLRKCVNHIRTWGLLPIIANGDGYYTSNEPKEIIKMALSLERRVSSILSAAKGLRDLAN